MNLCMQGYSVWKLCWLIFYMWRHKHRVHTHVLTSIHTPPPPPPPWVEATPLTDLTASQYFQSHHHSVNYCTCFAGWLLPLYNSFLGLNFYQGLCFCVMEMPVITIHYVVSWIWLFEIYVNLCARVVALRFSWLDQSVCVSLRIRSCMCRAHLYRFLKVEKCQTSIGGSECAATVDGASVRANYSCVICFSSRLKQPNQPTVSVTETNHQIALQWLG